MPFIFIWILAEIAGFIIVGEWIGVWWTLLLVVLSAVLGMAILRGQSMQMMRKMQEAMRQGKSPAMIRREVPFVMLAGILLIIPGFVSDIIALLLLIPVVPRVVIRWLKGDKKPKAQPTDVIEGEFWEESKKIKQYNDKKK